MKSQHWKMFRTGDTEAEKFYVSLLKSKYTSNVSMGLVTESTNITIKTEVVIFWDSETREETLLGKIPTMSESEVNQVMIDNAKYINDPKYKTILDAAELRYKEVTNSI